MPGRLLGELWRGRGRRMSDLSKRPADLALDRLGGIKNAVGLPIRELRGLLEAAFRDRGQRTDRPRAPDSPVREAGLAITAAPRSEISQAIASCRNAYWALAAFGGLSNVLMLTGSFFMLQVYDRVLPSRSVPTLVGLAILATTLYVLQGAPDLIRGRINVRVGRHLDETLSPRVYDALVRLPLKIRGDGDGLQPLRDLDQVRSFLGSGGPSALFDLPWIPLYLGICFLFHFAIGVTALAGAVVLVALTVLTEVRMRGPTKAAAQFALARSALAS